ncbi:MAG: TfuA domain-containing protein, partial [Hyphomicrobiales bacterium]|nr:TfuA domain-containing protein [Hyphomicrobiales bacterium]
MTSIIFVGPTLAPKEVGALGEFQCLPPVSQGDVYRAARKRPRAIGIVDGYFSGAPSVWHKEILWAISEGVPVFGSASMGALRAAELHSFGMRGMGRIFEAFRDGALEDDDEVAVLHGPAEIGHLPASEAMVNIRATLAFAETKGVLGERSRRAIEICAKSLFFGD